MASPENTDRLTNELAETTVQRDEWKRIAEDRGMELERLRADISQSRAAIEQLHAAVKTAQELAARRLMEIERLRKDLRECRSHLTDVIASQDRPAIKAAADWLSDWEGTRIDPGSAPEPSEQCSEVNSIDDVAAICHSVTGLCCHILGSPGGPCTIGNCAAVRGYLGGPEFAQGASRDASSDEFPECKDEPRDCPYIYCHSQLKCAKAPPEKSGEGQ